MIVADVNLIAYLFIPGEKTELARTALKLDPDWMAPLLWRSELRSTLALYLQKKLMQLDDAVAIADAAVDMMRGREHAVDSRDVLALASSTRLSAYDCEYIALARRQRVKLVTTDGPLAKAFPADTIRLDVFCKGGGSPE